MTAQLTRSQGWESRLASEIEAKRALPFAWGTHDCLMFASGVVRALTGVDFTCEQRGTYNDQLGSLRALRDVADGTLRGAVIDALGESVSVKLARRGDVVLWEQPEFGDTIGICLGLMACFAGPDGLVFIKTSRAALAWRIG